MRPGVWVAIGAGLIVIIAAIVGVVMWGKKEPWEEAGDRVKYVQQCIGDFQRAGALNYGNTNQQLEAACSCLADFFYPFVAGKSRAQAIEEMQKPEVKQKLLTQTMRCANKVGLNDVDEWF